MNRILNKWQIMWQVGKEFDRMESGWRSATVGIVRFTSFPPEGIRFNKSNYDGFLLEWRYFLPFENIKR